jgi:hemerythrin-like metal-binding protein
MVQLNRLLSDPTAHPTTVTFIEALSQLGVELSTHFKNEEALINSTGMPKHEIEQHVEAHTEILLQYTDLNMALMNKELPSREEALTMIKGWIVEHMAQYDTRIRHHVDCEAVA